MRGRHPAIIPAALAAAICLVTGCRESPDEPRNGGRSPAAERIRVACVGDSITYGMGIRDRARNCYPAVLGRLLGGRYEVRNFGVSGATMLAKGVFPYRRQRAFARATDFAPHIVVIMLGTNDAAPWNRRHMGEFAADCAAMVEHFRRLPSGPRVFLCLPPPVYMDGEERPNEAIPIIRQVAGENGVPLIDVDASLRGRPELFPDGVHPGAAGAEVMAKAVYRAITARGG
ncbi:MAG: GDSL-type esterase/lipase family protein [bacterium]|nr:GDSL-type esterase/lipase family protein [bacterium]